MINVVLRHPFSFSIALSAFFGFLFPTAAIISLLESGDLPYTWDNIVALHHEHHELLLIWNAPLVLSIFGSIIGKTRLLLKQKMDSLEYRTTQLNTILDAACSAIITIDKVGNILSFNQAAEQIFGYSIGEIVGQNVSRLMPVAIANQHDHYLENFLRYQKPNLIGKRNELQGLRKNGDIFPILLRVNPMTIDGELFFTGVIDDITETKTLQSQLGQAQKLEAIGQLASGVAHEINTPIQYIGDNLSALNDYFADIIACHKTVFSCADESFKPELDRLSKQYDLEFILEDSPKAIRQALEGVDRVAEIVKAMKTFSHVEQGLQKQSINLHEVINSSLTISRNSYKYIATIETDFSKEISNIECYANELNQVFLNLFINAVHAIEENKVEKGLIRIVTRKLDDMVEILIQDNGAGIPLEIQEKVFNLFFTTKPIGKGTGQGLSLSHNIIVEKHKGKLFFESKVGVGTTFHIQLPIHLKESE